MVTRAPLRDSTQANIHRSKYLYNLSNTPKKALSLAYSDSEYLCESSEKAPTPPLVSWYSRYEHRRNCHNICYTEAVKRAENEGRPAPKARRKCSTRRWAEHCGCFAGKAKLHQRLRGWMPRGLNYCSQCERFTKRKPQHKGRCKYALSLVFQINPLHIPVLHIFRLTRVKQAFTANRNHVFLRIISGRIVPGAADLDGKCGRSGSIIGQ